MKYSLRHAVTVIIACYFIFYALTATEWHFIDNINLIFHEAGHTLTFFFGQFISIASGSVFQILIPALCCLYFYQQGQRYSASLLLFWVGQNVINVSVYAKDAIVMQLPLLGGDNVMHDWNYVLSAMGLLRLTPYIADIIFISGIGILFCAFYFSIINSNEESKAIQTGV